jgi:hypothetical protein
MFKLEKQKEQQKRITEAELYEAQKKKETYNQKMKYNSNLYRIKNDIKQKIPVNKPKQ